MEQPIKTAILKISKNINNWKKSVTIYRRLSQSSTAVKLVTDFIVAKPGDIVNVEIGDLKFKGTLVPAAELTKEEQSALAPTGFGCGFLQSDVEYNYIILRGIDGAPLIRDTISESAPISVIAVYSESGEGIVEEPPLDLRKSILQFAHVVNRKDIETDMREVWGRIPEGFHELERSRAMYVLHTMVMNGVIDEPNAVRWLDLIDEFWQTLDKKFEWQQWGTSEEQHIISYVSEGVAKEYGRFYLQLVRQSLELYYEGNEDRIDIELSNIYVAITIAQPLKFSVAMYYYTKSKGNLIAPSILSATDKELYGYAEYLVEKYKIEVSEEKSGMPLYRRWIDGCPNLRWKTIFNEVFNRAFCKSSKNLPDMLYIFQYTPIEKLEPTVTDLVRDLDRPLKGFDVGSISPALPDSRLAIIMKLLIKYG